MITEKLAADLEEIVNKGLEEFAVPFVKGNSIRIKHIVIRKSPKGYLIYNMKDNCQIARVFFKSTAIAIAKNIAQGKNYTDKILNLEEKMSKHYNDALFFKHSMKTSKDPVRTEIIETRLDIALAESERVRNVLDRYIFS